MPFTLGATVEWKKALQIQCSATTTTSASATCTNDKFFAYESENWLTSAPINDNGATGNAIYNVYYSLYVTKVKVVLNDRELILTLKPRDQGRYTLKELVTGDGKLADGVSVENSTPDPFGLGKTEANLFIELDKYLIFNIFSSLTS